MILDLVVAVVCAAAGGSAAAVLSRIELAGLGRVALGSVVAAAAVACGMVGWWIGPAWHLAGFWWLAVVSPVLAVADTRTLRLPDRVVVPSIGVAAVTLSTAGLLEGDVGAAVRGIAGGAGMFAGYFVLMAVLPRGGPGGGDVKLAAVLGQYLGFLGWSALSMATLAGFLLGAATAVIGLASGRIGLQSRVAFGPAMLAGAWAVILWTTGLTSTG